jgi:hypothetical protein
VISSAISMLTGLIGDYQNSAPRCLPKDDRAFQCDAMVLGALIKSSVSIGLWSPPAPPFIGMSFCHLSGQIRQMMVPTLCDTIGPGKRNRYYDSDSEDGLRVSISGHCVN